MRSGFRRASMMVAALAGIMATGATTSRDSTPSPEAEKEYGGRIGARRRDTKPRFDRAHVNRRRKLALASKRRNR